MKWIKQKPKFYGSSQTKPNLWVTPKKQFNPNQTYIWVKPKEQSKPKPNKFRTKLKKMQMNQYTTPFREKHLQGIISTETINIVSTFRKQSWDVILPDSLSNITLSSPRSKGEQWKYLTRAKFPGQACCCEQASINDITAQKREKQGQIFFQLSS